MRKLYLFRLILEFFVSHQVGSSPLKITTYKFVVEQGQFNLMSFPFLGQNQTCAGGFGI